jgi:hypothetical protein
MTEAAAYARELTWVLGQLCVALRGLTPAQLAWRPDTGRANSAQTIVTHVLGATRVYALGFGCGQTITRDRDEEFAASTMERDVLIVHLEALATEVDAAIAGLTATDMERRLLPRRELWGTGEIHEISARDALVESIRHAALHLGELRLTRDLALRHA